jgi:hypothetical protein
METTLDNKLSILSELWLDYRDDEEFTDFIEYNDLGLPLAYAISTKIVEVTPSAEKFTLKLLAKVNRYSQLLTLVSH